PHCFVRSVPADQLSRRSDRLRRRRTATSAIPAASSPPLRIRRPPRLIPVTGRPGFFGCSLAGGSLAGGSLAGGSLAGGSLAGGSLAGGSLAGGSLAGGSLAGGGSVVGVPWHVWLKLNFCPVM